MHRMGVSDEVLARPRPPCKELVRVLISLEAIAGTAGHYEVPRVRTTATGNRLDVIQRRLAEGHHPAAIDAVMIAIAVSRGLECPAGGGGETVAALEALATGVSSDRTPQVVMMPEGGHADPARQSPKRSPERIIQSPRWLMTSHVHVRLSNTIARRRGVSQGLHYRGPSMTLRFGTRTRETRLRLRISEFPLASMPCGDTAQHGDSVIRRRGVLGRMVSHCVPLMVQGL